MLLFGDSPFAVRILPSFAHAGTVIAAGLIAKKMGGEKFAQLLSALIIGFAPGFLGIMGIYSMNAFDIFLWSVAFFLLLQLIETKESAYWIALGFIIGAGMMNKISMGWFAAGLVVGVIATPHREWLRTRYPWIAAGIALIMFLPFILWNMQHDFAHLEFANNAARLKYASQNPVTFFSGMIMLYNPVTLPVWLTGFYVLLMRTQREQRIIGIIVLSVLAILIININSKAEYFNPAAVAVIAAGAVQIEQWLSGRLTFLRNIYGITVLATGVLMMPMAIDILSVERLSSYMETIGIAPPNTEGHSMGALPQHFADRHGWKELTADVLIVYKQLDSAEQQHTMIYVQNYGEAAAIDFYGRQKGLPPAMSGHNNYWIWGNDRLDERVDVLIAVGGEAGDYLDTFEDIELVKYHNSRFAMPYESNLPIYVCRKPRMSIKQIWQTTKHFI